MRYLAVLALLAGCATTPAGEPTCIDARSVLGSKITHSPSGRIGTVTKLYGPVAACKDSPAFPILADVRYE